MERAMEASMTTKSAKDLVAEASREVTTLSAEEALDRLARTETVLVDVRESEELAKTGRIAGAVHVPRGVLEFQADPASPTHKAELGGGRSLILYCASGNRSALAAKALQEMGLAPVAHVAGGFAALEKAGGLVEPA
jgi:rhodanese-related sulfurtransferase